ncbi:ATP-binding protein [Streptomyces sp. N2-109]|uniref:ATP-binding protein n=1 Tax=Streptomyces gossypii TaxID=2883101 RepID=A0ABT2JL02_9ACTN|nr:ATP-binding protein [Streptomyces gossypii]
MGGAARTRRTGAAEGAGTEHENRATEPQSHRATGPQGHRATGKSHPTEGLAQTTAGKDLRVSWFTLETLSTAVGKSKADGPTARTLARICRAGLIVIDDTGLLPADGDAAEAFYRITDAAYERHSIAATSNIHPPGSGTITPKPLAGTRPPHAPRPPRDHHGRLASPRRGPRRPGSGPP